MADQYVSTTGDDGTGDGSIGNPWATIQKGIDEIGSDDTCWVKTDGTYTITGTIDFDGADNKTCKSYYSSVGDQDYGGAYYKDPTNGWGLIDIDGGAFSAVTFGDNDFMYFENFKIINPSTSVIISTTNVVYGAKIFNCWFVGNSTAAYLINSLHFTDLLIHDCKFTGQWTTNARGEQGIMLFSSTAATSCCEVSYCKFDISDAITLINFSGTAYKQGIVHHCTFHISGTVANEVIKGTSTFYNNTIYGESGASVAAGITTAFENNIIYNNIIEGVTTPIDNTSGSELQYQDFNCYTGNSEANGISTDPQLADPDNNDFRVMSASLLHGGRPDRDGNRTQIGAIQREYQFAYRGRPANLGRLAIVR